MAWCRSGDKSLYEPWPWWSGLLTHTHTHICVSLSLDEITLPNVDLLLVSIFGNASLRFCGNTINSFALGRSECDSRIVIFNLCLLIGIFRSSHDNALWWMPQDLPDDKSTLVQVMTWRRQATSHYLSQFWLSSLSPYGVARPQRVNINHNNLLRNSIFQAMNIFPRILYHLGWLSDIRHGLIGDKAYHVMAAAVSVSSFTVCNHNLCSSFEQHICYWVNRGRVRIRCDK